MIWLIYYVFMWIPKAVLLPYFQSLFFREVMLSFSCFWELMGKKVIWETRWSKLITHQMSLQIHFYSLTLQSNRVFSFLSNINFLYCNLSQPFPVLCYFSSIIGIYTWFFWVKQRNTFLLRKENIRTNIICYAFKKAQCLWKGSWW